MGGLPDAGTSRVPHHRDASIRDLARDLATSADLATFCHRMPARVEFDQTPTGRRGRDRRDRGRLGRETGAGRSRNSPTERTAQK